ncbi:MAG: flagellar biosynthesis anti-sigma factor FlgM [Burkholderiaceae bacterium]
MKIGPLENKAAVAGTSTERKPAVGHGGGSGAARPEPSAKVELSSAGALLSRAEADGTFDTQKVERLADAIRNGSFQVDAGAIADKLLAHAKELLGRSTQ